MGILFTLTNVCIHINAFMVKVMFQPPQKVSSCSFTQIWDCCSCSGSGSLEVTFKLLDSAGQSLKSCLEPKDVLLSSCDFYF